VADPDQAFGGGRQIGGSQKGIHLFKYQMSATIVGYHIKVVSEHPVREQPRRCNSRNFTSRVDGTSVQYNLLVGRLLEFVFDRICVPCLMETSVFHPKRALHSISQVKSNAIHSMNHLNAITNQKLKNIKAIKTQHFV